MAGSGRPKFETIVTQVEKEAHIGFHGHGGQGHHGYGLGHHGSHGHAPTHGHHGHGHGLGFGLGGHGHDHPTPHHESYELSLLHDHHSPGHKSKSRGGSPDPIVDTLTYRTSTRVVAVVDIVSAPVLAEGGGFLI